MPRARQVAVLISLVAGGMWSCSGGSEKTAGPSGPKGGGASGGSAGTGSIAGGSSGMIGTGGAAAGGGQGGSGTGGGGAGVGGTGGQSGQGGSTGTGLDGSPPDVNFAYDAAGGAGGLTADSACAKHTEQATLSKQPADIIWAIDTSGSMSDEAAAVQGGINSFSQQIVASGIDVHVVMLAGYPLCLFGICGPGICVPAPLGTGQCPADTKLPSFFHHQTAVVNSVDAAVVLVNTFPDYRQMLRAGSLKHLVVVTDDDSRSTGGSGNPGVYDNNPDRFIADYTALDPVLRDANGARDWHLSAIYSFTQCANAAAEGIVWRQIVDKTGGVHGDICGCTSPAACAQSFQTILNRLATAVVSGAQLACQFPVPRPAQGIVNWDQVSLEVSSAGGMPQRITKVAGANNCANGGFYYDNPTNPTQIILCPSTCATAKAISNAKIDVLLGCLGS